MNEEQGRILGNLIRVGKVSSVDTTYLRARVYFDDLDMVSDWLPVIQHNGAGVNVTDAGSHTHTITVSQGSGSAGSSGTHSHSAKLANWMPDVNDTVLCLYLPMFNADGFILGAIP